MTIQPVTTPTAVHAHMGFSSSVDLSAYWAKGVKAVFLYASVEGRDVMSFMLDEAAAKELANQLTEAVTR